MRIILAILLLMPLQVLGAVYHVSESGTRTSGASTAEDWSNANCYGTIIAAIQQMSGGDEVIVNEGTYTGVENVIGRDAHVVGAVTPPAGSAGAYTKISARYPLDVDHKTILDSGANSDGEWDSWANHIFLNGTSYIEIDGFFINARDNSSYNSVVVTSGAHHIKVKRVTLRRTVTTTGSIDASLFEIAATGTYSGDPPHDVLLEDCSATGHYRYMFSVMGYSSEAAQDRRSYNIIFRRCVGRADYTVSSSPLSIFEIYGHRQNADMGPYNIAYQNCIAIDSNLVHTDNADCHTPWYFFNGHRGEIKMVGCITLNNIMADNMHFEVSYEGSSATNYTISNSIFWNNKSASDGAYHPFHLRGGGLSGDTTTVSGCTFGDQYQAFRYTEDNSGVVSTLTNNLFYDLSGAIISNNSPDTQDYNSFDVSAQERGTNVVTYDAPDYICRVESDSTRYGTGLAGANVGAHIVNRHGTDGTLWGETGYDTESATSLWPWPYEDAIRDWFSVTNDPPSGASPATNDTARGFCATGVTLTSYIWETLGNATPEEFGGGSTPAPAPPTLSNVTISNGSFR